MRRLFVFLTAIFTILTASAEVEHSIILDQSSFRKVNTDALTGVNVDPIRKDSSRNACARVKIQFANMSRAEVDALVIQFRSNTDLVRQEIGYYDNVLILEMTAKSVTRFYVQSPDYGQSNEVTLNLEGDCEYEMEARLNQSFSIAVSTNVEGAEVYIDGRMKGRTGSNLSLTIKDVMIGSHTLKLVYGSAQAEQQIEVNGSSIIFRQDLSVDVERFDVTFKVQPATATIVVDNNGLELPINNGMFSLKLSKGTHTYEIKAKDYRTALSSFVVTDGAKQLQINLTPAFGWLEVNDAKLVGAKVAINGDYVGTVPFKSGNLASGTYSVSLEKSLYKSFESIVTINDNEVTHFSPTLEANFANVTLTAPNDAEIWINGSKKGVGQWRGDLEVGNYTFEARKSAHRTTQLTREISAQPASQSYSLSAPTPIYGSLVVNSSSDTSVAIDGKNIGQAPVTLDNILIGKHIVIVSKSGYNSKTQNVTIVEGQTSTLNVELSSIPNCEIHYTSTDGDVVWPYFEGVDYFGAEIVSNTYKDGQGVIVFNGDVTMIGYEAFYRRGNLKSIIIPDGITTIGKSAFKNCENLTSVTIGSSVKSIGGGAFLSCSGLKSVYISDLSAWCKINFKNGDANPLWYAKNLYLSGRLVTELTIPEGITEIKSCAFEGCKSLTKVTIPSSVTSIGNYAFSNCDNIVSFTIPNSITSIGYGAFGDCASLRSIVIPDSVTSIAESVFRGCRSLTDVKIGKGVSTIENHTFSGCRSLTTLTIPKSVKSIKICAFSYCVNLASVYCYAVEPPVLETHNLFSDSAKKPKVYVPASVVKAYKKDYRWNDSGKIVAM